MVEQSKLGFLLLQIVLPALICMPLSTLLVPQNDTFKSAVITDTKFYFPSFFEEKSTIKRWSQGGSFSQYAIYSGRALRARTR